MRVSLIVPFEEKDLCKENGGRWDADNKEWYTENMNDNLKPYKAVRLYVPYEEKDEAKEKGAIWNKALNSWVISQGKSSSCKKWLKDNRKYLKVPIEKKDIVKAEGGRWDPENKLWYFDSKVPEHLKAYTSDFKRV